jgi:hypothetical protein
MKYTPFLSRRSGAALVVTVVSGLAVAGCGGGSSHSSSAGAPPSSAFATAANTACADESSAVGGVYESVGEQYKPFTGPWAAGTSAGIRSAIGTELSSLQTLKPPAAQAATYHSFLGALSQHESIVGEEQSAASAGNSSKFASLQSQDAPLSQTLMSLAGKMGLASCADHGLSSADVSQITHIITSTPVTNNPSQCTQDYTLAFVKQAWGSMAACIQNGKRPVGPSNPQSVTVSGMTGAGDLAIAQVTFHFSSGKIQHLAVAAYRQNGQWRLQGFRSE